MHFSARTSSYQQLIGCNVGSYAKPGTTSVSRNVTINGHRTSLRLQSEMWDAIDEICRRERLSIHEFCSRIALQRNSRSLTSEVRVYTMAYYRAAASDEGHVRAGHGVLEQQHMRIEAQAS
jgi:predicted DNA-binding ribbon-helix-helix protein